MSLLTIPATNNEVITDALATHGASRGIYIGADDNYDLYIGGAWTLYNGMKAGVVYPFRAKGARHASGDTAPDAGDVTFLS